MSHETWVWIAILALAVSQGALLYFVVTRDRALALIVGALAMALQAMLEKEEDRL